MAEGTSVGTISLDVEFNQGSIDTEMGKLSKSFNNSFKVFFNGMMGQTNNFVKSSIGKVTGSFKNIEQTGTNSSEKVSKSINKMNSEYEKTEVKIAKIRDELSKLFTEQDEIASFFQGLPSLSGMSKEDSIEHLLKSNPRYNELSNQIDDLISKLDPLVEKNKRLADEINNIGNNAEITGSKINILGRNSDDAGKNIEKSSWKVRLFGDESQKASNKTNGLISTINRSFNSIMKRLFIYNLIMKGIRGVMNYMGAALQTNAQFVNSLNIIKTNLMVAFQPIYTFILPALNALMSAVATVTTYIASAISALFGKSYKQSFNAAKGMNQVAKSMGGAGKAAKGAGKAAKKAGEDAKKSLAGFDEINNLDLDKGTPDTGSGGGGGGAGGFEMAMPDMSKIDMTGINKFKEIMSKIFEPFKLAWQNEGQATIDSMKYALTSVWGLSKEIGKSWLEVWANGTGQFMLETILRILQNVFYIIGDIANSFALAWVEGGRGTEIIQHLFNIIQHVLSLVERLTGAFREVWGEVGDNLARLFLETLKQILSVFDHLGEKLIWVWDNGGERLFQGFLRLGTKILEVAGYVLNEFIFPLAKGFISIAAPAVAKLMDWVGKLLDKFSNLVNWLLGDGKPVLDTIIIVLGSMATAFKIVSGAITAKILVLKTFTSVMGIAKGALALLKGAVLALTTPFGIAVIAIGAAIAIGVALWKNWDTVKAKAGQLGSYIRTKFNEIKTFITSPIKSAIDAVSKQVDRLKGFFSKLTLKIPKPKIPKFSLKGNFSLMPPSVPKIDVDWYDKGGIFTGPQVIGVGEKRPEFVGALDDLRTIVRDEILGVMSMFGELFGGSKDEEGDLVLEIDGDEFARIAIKAINKRRRKAGLPLLTI